MPAKIEIPLDLPEIRILSVNLLKREGPLMKITHHNLRGFLGHTCAQNCGVFLDMSHAEKANALQVRSADNSLRLIEPNGLNRNPDIDEKPGRFGI